MAARSNIEGKRFEADLKAIRLKREIPLDHIATSTRLQLEVLEMFEKTGLREDTRYSEVYIRAFVKQYAELLGIDPVLAIEAQRESEKGIYRGILAVEYLSLKELLPLPNTAHINAKTNDNNKTNKQPVLLYAGGGIAILLIVWLLISFVFTNGSNSIPAETPNPVNIESTSGADLTQTSDFGTNENTVIPERTLPAKPTLGDSLNLHILAQGVRLEPIRIAFDGGEFQPYWIEPDTFQTFTAKRQFKIYGWLEKTAATVEGISWNTASTVQDTSIGKAVLTIHREEVLAVKINQWQQTIDSLEAQNNQN